MEHIKDSNPKSYYLKCLISGTLASGISHFMFTPLDLYKTIKQSDISFTPSLKQVSKSLIQKEGYSGLFTGWKPTVTAYGFHGLVKFSLYEVLKKKFTKQYGGDLNKNRYKICLKAAAIAEFAANIFICPLEVLKIRLQSSTHALLTAQNKLSSKEIQQKVTQNLKNENWSTLYKGIGLIWLRQIPLTVSAFCTFEATSQGVYEYIYKKPRNELSVANHLLVSLIASYMSGSLICALVSHPADTIITNLYKHNSPSSSGSFIRDVKGIISNCGFKGLFTGLYPRGFYIGFLIPTQLFLYDVFKVSMGLATTASV